MDGDARSRSPQDINFMDPEVQKDWFSAYEVLHRDAPVYFMPELGMYVITKWEDIRDIVRQPELFTVGSDVQQTEPLVKFPQARALYEQKGWPRYTPLGENVPKHRHYRDLVDPYLTPVAVARREPFIRALVNELIDGWIDQGEVEFLKAFAEPLPMMVIADFLGFPRMDLPSLKRWSAAWVAPFARGLTLEAEMKAVSEHIELQHYIFDQMKDKRKNPGDDLLTKLVQAEFYDVDLGETRALRDNEIIGVTDHLLIGGNETTAFALSKRPVAAVPPPRGLRPHRRRPRQDQAVRRGSAARRVAHAGPLPVRHAGCGNPRREDSQGLDLEHALRRRPIAIPPNILARTSWTSTGPTPAATWPSARASTIAPARRSADSNSTAPGTYCWRG